MKEDGMLIKIIDWVVANSKGCIAGVFCVVVLILVLFQKGDERVYFQAENAMTNWKKNNNDKTLEILLSKVLKKKDLESKYHSFLVENDLENGDINNLERKLKKVMPLLKEEFPLHALFSHTSLLMEKKDFTTALKETLYLKKKLKEEGKEESLLNQFNEYRLITIYSELEDTKNELASMENLSISLPLSEKEISFSDYLECRKERLKS